MNLILLARITARKVGMAQGKGVVSSSEVASKPPLTPKCRNQDKIKGMPTLYNKRMVNTTIVADT